MRFQNRRAGRLRSCPFPARRPNQSLAVLVRNNQGIRRTLRVHTIDPHANKSTVVSPMLYSGSSTTALVRMHNYKLNRRDKR